MPKKDQSSQNHCQTSDAFFPQEEAFSESAMHRRILKVCFLNTIQRRHRRDRCGVFFVCFFQRFVPMADRLTDWPTSTFGWGSTFHLQTWRRIRNWFVFPDRNNRNKFHLKKNQKRHSVSHCTFEILSCRMVNRIGPMAFQRSFYPRNCHRSVPKRYVLARTSVFLVVYPPRNVTWLAEQSPVF